MAEGTILPSFMYVLMSVAVALLDAACKSDNKVHRQSLRITKSMPIEVHEA